MRATAGLDRLVELNAAHHELGHGIAARAAGLRVTGIRLIRAADGVAATGVTRVDDPRPDAPPRVWDGFAVMLFAGIAAQTRHAEQIGHLDRGVARRIERAAAGDYEAWLQARPRCSLTESAARRRAGLVVGRRWRRFEALAERLVADLYLPGGAL